MLTFLIKSPGHKPYTKCLPSNAAALQDAQARFPGSAPACVVNLRMSSGHLDFIPIAHQRRRCYAVPVVRKGTA